VTVPNTLYNPDVTGNRYNGNYLVVWEQENANGGGYDVYGQLISHGDYPSIYLPLIHK
jgi:hypothetical protein